MLVSIPWIAMPNVLAGRRVVPELIQGAATAEGIVRESVALLRDGGRYRRVSEDLIALRSVLRGKGGASRVARLAAHMARGDAVETVLDSTET